MKRLEDVLSLKNMGIDPCKVTSRQLENVGRTAQDRFEEWLEETGYKNTMGFVFKAFSQSKLSKCSKLNIAEFSIIILASSPDGELCTPQVVEQELRQSCGS